MNNRGLVVEMPRTWLCDVLIMLWVGKASAVFDSVRNVMRDDSLWYLSPVPSAFLDFCWPFYSSVWERIGPKTFERKDMIGWKMDFFNCEFSFYISTGWLRRAYLHSNVFYSFFIILHPDNIRFMLPFFFNWNICLRYFICLFIYSFCRWVGLKFICKSEAISEYNTGISWPMSNGK